MPHNKGEEVPGRCSRLFHLLIFVMIIVLTTVPTTEEAESLAVKIVEAKLAGCVQVLPQMASFYFWEGKIQKDAEHLLLIKTLASKCEELESFIKSNHSYAVPEIVVIDTERVSGDYLKWLRDYVE